MQEQLRNTNFTRRQRISHANQGSFPKINCDFALTGKMAPGKGFQHQFTSKIVIEAYLVITHFSAVYRTQIRQRQLET
jgi:hypothetical protein